MGCGGVLVMGRPLIFGRAAGSRDRDYFGRFLHLTWILLAVVSRISLTMIPVGGGLRRFNVLFCVEDVSTILSTPLGNHDSIDTKIWHYSKSGLFTVCSAHHLIKNLGLHCKSEVVSNSTGGVICWSQVWKINCPNKIKIFLWRVCKNIISTGLNLTKRKLQVCADPVVCESEPKDLNYCFQKCDVARQMWALLVVPFSYQKRDAKGIEDWINKLFCEATKDLIRLIVIGCWTIWRNRNRILVGEDAMEPGGVVDLVLGTMQVWDKAKTSSIESKQLNSVLQWHAPDENWIKVNFDGAIFHEEGESGLGVIVRDWQGQCLAWSQRLRISGVLEPKVMEALVAQLAVQVGMLSGCPRIIIEGDCLEFILDIAETEKCGY